MALNATDEIYVNADPAEVYRALIGLSDDASWWPGARTGGGYGWVWVRAPAGRRMARVRFKASIPSAREPEAITWLLEEGELRGRAEWWLEPFKRGTIVHYYLDVERGPRGRARRTSSVLRRHRFAVRRGINALKDALEHPRT